MFHVIEKYRILGGTHASDASYGNNGAFKINRGRTIFAIIASDGEGWEHVSVHCISDGKNRTPTWSEMCYIKDLFWNEDDCVLQYHPAKSEYINQHEHTLHLWNPIDIEFPVPDKMLVGF